ncbi:MAG: hypothetical protein ACI8W3_003592 [Myxococcota bacterium]|jgi:hypothetical protein
MHETQTKPSVGLTLCSNVGYPTVVAVDRNGGARPDNFKAARKGGIRSAARVPGCERALPLPKHKQQDDRHKYYEPGTAQQSKATTTLGRISGLL